MLFENRNIPINKKSYFGNDVRRFQCTKAWNLAKAVEDQYVWEIERQVRLLKVPVDCRDRINKFTRVSSSMFHFLILQYNSKALKFKVLLI